MTKKKFELTSDLVKIESEPNTYNIVEKPFKKILRGNAEPKEQINLKISGKLKSDFQIWCINQNKTMTEGLEEALDDLLKKT